MLGWHFSPRHRYFFFMILLAVGCFFMYQWAEHVFAPSETWRSSPVAEVMEKAPQGEARIGGPFELKDSRGIPYTSDSFKGKYRLMYFGYTYCPDICPTALQNLTQMLDRLGHQKQKLQVIFITIDPQRDTPQHIESYKKNYHPRILMLTGNPQKIQEVIKSFAVYVTRANPQDTSAHYLLDHSSLIYLMDPQGRYLTAFAHETPAEHMLKILQRFIK